MRMPFGIHKGVPIEDLDGIYLSWLLSQDWLQDPLLCALEQELRRRKGEQKHRPATPPIAAVRFLPPADIAPFAAEIVALGFRASSKRHHPDAGGPNDEFLRLEQARQWLEKLVCR